MHDIEFKLKPSKCYLLLLVLLLFMSVAVIIYVPMTIAIKGVVLAALFLYLSRVIWQVGLLQGKQVIIRLKYSGDASWSAHTHKDTYTVVLCGDTVLTRFVSLLRFRLPNAYFTQSCLIFYDSLSLGEYRKLRVYLSFQ